MKAASLKRKGNALRFRGKIFRVFERERLDGVRWQQGCFAQDAVGEWWLCLPVKVRCGTSVSGNESSPDVRVPSQTSSLREAGPHALRAAA